MTDLVSEVVHAVQAVLGRNHFDRRPVALHEVKLQETDFQSVTACLDSGWVSTAGLIVEEFESEIARACDVPFAIATSSGSAALQLALLSLGVGPHDEVMMPPLTFVATANSASHAGAVPHFIDIDESTLGMSPDALDRQLSQIAKPQQGVTVNRETGRRIAAVVPVHVFGHPCRVDEIVQVASNFGLPVVEDAAESLGSLWKGASTGGFGVASALSFNGNKIVTCGSGGALLTRDPFIAERGRLLANNARSDVDYGHFHREIGFNFRMAALNASLGRSQLKRLDSSIEAKRRLAERYFSQFAGVTDVTVMREPAGARSNYWLQTLVLSKSAATRKVELLAALNDYGLQSRAAWHLMPSLPPYRSSPRGPIDCAEHQVARLLNVPSSAHLLDEDTGA